MKQQSPGELIREMEAIQAIWDALTTDAKCVSGRIREPLQVAGYAAGDEPWALFLFPPEAGERPLPPRLLLVQKTAGIVTTCWVV